jgi:alpha-tubulin suppressor-like RCC1 family protein
MVRGAWATVVLVVGCGRVSFDEHSDAGNDAPVACRMTQISAGEGHICALFADGTVQCWGNNNYGQLGEGQTTLMSATPVQVLASPGGPPLRNVAQISMGAGWASCARMTDGTAWCWGDNRSGELGDGTQAERHTPVQIMASPGVPLTNVASIQVGEDNACAVLTDGSVWCWGANMYGQVGNPAAGGFALMPLQAVPSGMSAAFVSVQHACAWTPSGQLSCWGHGEGGRLGYGGSMDQQTPIPITLPNVESAASVYRHTCAIAGGGNAYCWGYDNSGELGDGATGTNQYTPVTVHGPGNVGAFTSATEIATADTFTCARRSDATIWCWGNNGTGGLGNGQQGVSSNVPIQVPLGVPAGSITLTNRGACALSTDGLEVWCWGYGLAGEIGDGNYNGSNTPVKALVGCQ